MAKPKHEPSGSEITAESAYQRRREFMRTAGLMAATATGVGGALLGLTGGASRRRVLDERPDQKTAPLAADKPSVYTVDEAQTPYKDVTSYNNFYEFGLDKGDPADNARAFVTRPWTLTVEGEVDKPQRVDIEQLLKWFPVEERVYRMRCVEAWSMVIPWLGFPLGEVLKRVGPTSRAKFVAFTTLLDPEQMPGQRDSVLAWPYVEALRLDEAMHPLTLLAAGLYGKTLPPFGPSGRPRRDRRTNTMTTG